MKDRLERAFDREASSLDDDLATGAVSRQQYNEEMRQLEREGGHEEQSQGREHRPYGGCRSERW